MCFLAILPFFFSEFLFIVVIEFGKLASLKALSEEDENNRI